MVAVLSYAATDATTVRHACVRVQLFKESTEDAASKGLILEGMTSPQVPLYLLDR